MKGISFFKEDSVLRVYESFPVCACAPHACRAQGGQKRFQTARNWNDRCECWELNSSPLEEKPVLSTTEPSLRTQFLSSYKKGLCILIHLRK